MKEKNICDFCKIKARLSKTKIDEGEEVMICESCKESLIKSNG